MIISCPQCQTKFHLDEGRIPEGGAQARCSRCQHIFDIQRGKGDASTQAPSAAEPRPSPEEERPAAMPDKKRSSLIRWLVILLLLAVMGGGIWGLAGNFPYLRQAESFLGSLRESLGLADSSPGQITLENLRGYYSENVHLKWIFVVEGQAVNQWNESRSFIKVKGTLLDARSKKVEEKIVFCGNILGEKELREMTRDSIQKSLSSQFGVSFSNVNIPPRKAVPFMIVFTDFAQNDPEKNSSGSPALSDFSVEVLSSRKGSK
jgi:predicted Zn finger-like uncharacterized protein